METSSDMRIFPTAAYRALAPAILLMAGCAGNGSPNPPTAVVPQQFTTGPRVTSAQNGPLTASESWLQPASSQEHLIYVDYFQTSPTTQINIYSEQHPHHLVG